MPTSQVIPRSMDPLQSGGHACPCLVVKGMREATRPTARLFQDISSSAACSNLVSCGGPFASISRLFDKNPISQISSSGPYVVQRWKVVFDNLKYKIPIMFSSDKTCVPKSIRRTGLHSDFVLDKNSQCVFLNRLMFSLAWRIHSTWAIAISSCHGQFFVGLGSRNELPAIRAPSKHSVSDPPIST